MATTLEQHEPSRRVGERLGDQQVVDDDGAQGVGLLVDGVSEVLRLAAEDVEPVSEAATGRGTTSVLGVARVDDRLILLLDLASTLGKAEG